MPARKGVSGSVKPCQLDVGAQVRDSGTWQRGIRREIPSIAVIASYNNGFIIHDGDDQSLPISIEMWQYVGDSSGSTAWWGGSGTGGGIAAMNGEMAVINGGGGRVFNFSCNSPQTDELNILRASS